MTTKSFVAKVSRIKNKKDKEYYIHRINLPSEVTKELELQNKDYVFLKAKKAEWYHMLEWSTMSPTWNKLPLDTKQKIIDDGLIQEKIDKEYNLPKMKESKTMISAGMSNLINTGCG